MTDWRLIRDNIARSLIASEKFNEAGEAVIESPEEQRIREFAEQLVDLQTKLQNILEIIGPASPIAIDAIADAISNAMYGHPAKHHITPESPRA